MVGVGGWILLVEQLLLELAREASFPFIQNIEKIPREKNLRNDRFCAMTFILSILIFS